MRLHLASIHRNPWGYQHARLPAPTVRREDEPDEITEDDACEIGSQHARQALQRQQTAEVEV